MNTKILASALLAAAGLVAAPAFAGGGVNASGEVGYVPPVAAAASSAGLSREAVRNEFLQAQRNHQLPATGEGADAGYVASAGSSTLTREQVQGAYLTALQNHQLAPRGEGADIGYRPSTSTLSREAVHAEAVRALRAGDLPGGEV